MSHQKEANLELSHYIKDSGVSYTTTGQQATYTPAPAGKTSMNTMDQLTMNLSQDQTRKQDSLDQN